MRKVLGAAFALTLLPFAADAEDRYLLRQDQSGLNLPGVSLPQGFDEVRAADGTSCRSSNTGAGAYADVGVIGSNDNYSAVNSGAVYGRVVVPLGQTGTRLDCRRLYDLEIQRLQSEVRLLKAGLSRTQGTNGDSAARNPALEEGWTDTGRNGASTPATTGSVASASQPEAAARPASSSRRSARQTRRPAQHLAAGSALRGSLAE